jgi:hypothetical protein
VSEYQRGAFTQSDVQLTRYFLPFHSDLRVYAQKRWSGAMEQSWVEPAFWVFCILAFLGTAWWAKKVRDHDAARANRNDRHL